MQPRGVDPTDPTKSDRHRLSSEIDALTIEWLKDRKMSSSQTESNKNGLPVVASGQKGRTRQQYEKPSLLVISLVAEEVLAVGCKLDGGGSGPIGASCTASACQAPGS